MANKNVQCSKCKGEMVQGFVPDFYQSATFVASWHEGRPKKSLWTKTKAWPHEGMPIGAFRCKECGFLEFFADPKFAAK